MRSQQNHNRWISGSSTDSELQQNTLLYRLSTQWSRQSIFRWTRPFQRPHLENFENSFQKRRTHHTPVHFIFSHQTQETLLILWYTWKHRRTQLTLCRNPFVFGQDWPIPSIPAAPLVAVPDTLKQDSKRNHLLFLSFFLSFSHVYMYIISLYSQQLKETIVKYDFQNKWHRFF